MDGALEWVGPITQVARPSRTDAGADYTEIRAMDKSAWLLRRTLPEDLATVAGGSDAGALFKALIELAVLADNEFGLYCPTFTAGATLSRQFYTRSFEYVFDMITDLANSAVDWFVIGQDLAVESRALDGLPRGWFIQDGGVERRQLAYTPDEYGRYIFGLFTDQAWTQRPGWTKDGMSQGNFVVTPGGDSGETGFRRFWTADGTDADTGLLTWVDVNPLYQADPDGVITGAEEEAFQARADSTLALRQEAPLSLTGGSLSQDAPVTRDRLFPGSLWAIDLAEPGFSRLATIQRLKRIDMQFAQSRAGLSETVSPTLIPLGTDESEGG